MGFKGLKRVKHGGIRLFFLPLLLVGKRGSNPSVDLTPVVRENFML
jgi:hypothetical protein